MQTLASEFKSALSLIEIKDDRRKHAIAAHTEIRECLEADEQLREWGIETVLIGSYARHTSIWPGKDVDVFMKLKNLEVGGTDPRTIYEHTRTVLVEAFGNRAQPQPRSITVNFDRDGFKFSVDAVPAVRWGTQWAIPRRDTATWDEPDEQRWVRTDPEQLNKLTEAMNARVTVDGKGAYVPTVKLVRQTRSHHRGDEKPGGFYFELMTYWAFEWGQAMGSSFAGLFATTLESLRAQLQSGQPLQDPVLGEDYKPQPDSGARDEAAQVFASLASKAVSTDDKCKAAALWREILGKNDDRWCFPVPDGCDEHGNQIPVTSAASSRGSRGRGGFA